MELLINRKETSSEAPPKHMHITHISFKQDAPTKTYVYDVTLYVLRNSFMHIRI